MRYKRNKSQGLALSFKEEFEVSKLFISSYTDNKININNAYYDFPICIFGQKIFELSLKNLNALKSDHIQYLNSQYFSVNSTYPELILIGINDYNFRDILRLRVISKAGDSLRSSTSCLYERPMQPIIGFRLILFSIFFGGNFLYFR